MLTTLPVLAGNSSAPTGQQARSQRQLITILAVAVFTTALLKRLAGATGDNFVGTWSDDFFYYLKAAMNIVAGKGSTFDGTIATNGYHPLWVLCLTALVAILSSTQAVLIALSFIVAVATAITFVLARRLSALITGSEGAISILVALYSTCYFYVVAKHGMEIIITVPLMMYLTLRTLQGRGRLEEPRDGLRTGVLAALLVLSRLDTLLLIALYFVGALSSRRSTLAAFVRASAYFAIGFTPVLAYLISNLHFFGALMPISGAAKQLAPSPWQHPILRGFAISDNLHYAFVYPVVAASVLALGLVVSNRARETAFERRAGLFPNLIFPFVFYTAQVAMTDWPFWDWYLYPWLAAAPLAISLACKQWRSPLVRLSEKADAWLVDKLKLAASVIALGSLAIAALDFRRPLPELPIDAFSKTLTRFSEAHPGRYAMGDRAGMVGIRLPFPLVQLEGLMEDRRFLDHIRARDNLNEVLRKYDIDYYASTGAVESEGCYRTTEPRQAGPGSPRMEGVFCQRPVLEFHSDFDGTNTLVFALK